MSERDFSGLLPGPVTGLPLLPLSISASTASWSILFSFLTMMSGAPRSSSLFNLLFLLITLRYKSLRSEVANLPPSSCTIGLRSGGMTGMTSRIIHSGLFSESRRASMTSSLLTIRIFFCPDASRSFFLISSDKAMRSIWVSSSRIASAPMAALNPVPNFSFASLYCCSVRISL
ncbi:hypothetical protein SDC9_183389 [bioreactor metagenome]|uniref:Uncharacterized protein n=1 Tax=bioreactor metagenome TaxID=1076179 RepID=A0A645HA30_9ZZZZ